jgi:hypothetical protein
MGHREMVNLVAAYGCSFTEGQELPDEQFIKDAELQKKNLGWRKFAKKYRDVIHSEEYLKAAKNLAWPKYIADLYDVGYYNNALGGSSLEAVCYKLTLDVNRKIVDSNSLILIGLPNIARWVWPMRMYERHFLSNMLDLKEKEARAFAKVHTDAKLLHYYYSNLESLELLAIKHDLNIKCYCMWEDIPSAILNLKDHVTMNYYDYMTTRWNSIKESKIFNWEKKLADYAKFPNCSLGGGHYTQKVHIDFAKYVYEDTKR